MPFLYYYLIYNYLVIKVKLKIEFIAFLYARCFYLFFHHLHQILTDSLFFDNCNLDYTHHFNEY